MTATKVRVIDVEWLRAHDACVDQIELFAATFGESVPLSADSVRRAAEVGLDLDWLAEQILSAAAWRSYREATAPALWACEEATAEALRAYKQAKAPAARAFEEAAAAALIATLGLS